MANPTTITIDTVAYDVYADTDYVTEYMAGAIHGDAWAAATEVVQQKACISFTRFLDRQVWQGTKTADDQPLAWPRTGLLYADGSAVDPDTIPTQFLAGFCEGCLALVEGSTVQTESSTESNVASLTAGSVAITFWRGAGGEPMRMPVILDELLGLWLASSAELGPAISASGIDGCSGFKDDFGFTEGV